MLKGWRCTATVVLVSLCTLSLFVYARSHSGNPLQPSVADAEKLAGALSVYLGDWDERFPPMKTQAEFQKALWNYVPHSVFTCPFTNQLYQPNPELSRRFAAGLRDFGAIPAVSAAIPGAAPLVAYLDGHVQQGKIDLTDPTAETAQYAKRVTLAVFEYAQDYDEVLPPAKNTDQFEQEIAPYVGDQHAFTCPLSGKRFRFNPQLRGVSLAGIADITTVPIVWDTPAQPSSQSVVAYYDPYAQGAQRGPDGDPYRGVYVERGGVDLSDTILEGQDRIGGLITALNLYAQEYDGLLPPMQNAAVFKQALYPTAPSDRIFISPFSQQPYAPNAALSGKSLQRLGDLSRLFAVEDPLPAADGKIMVGYLDGYITRGGANLGDPTAETIRHATQLSGAIRQYLQDHNFALPPMATFTQFRDSLFPYVRASRVFTCPYTHLLFTINTALNGHSFSDFSDPSAVVVLQDPKPERDGRRTTLYLDGHLGHN